MSNLALYASDAAQSRGRLVEEPAASSRTAFQRDRDRIIHSTAFRRLMYKTQVFVNHEGDYFRTRLTHSLEVAQIARSISRSLRLDTDLAEALALAHDLGHPPFGHLGEEALNEVMAGHGGFDHNDQTLRVLTYLEERYPQFNGLNLTWETLEGTVKHNGPIAHPSVLIAAYMQQQDLMLHSYPSAEAQVASLSDDIAYNNHDIDDGLRAGLFDLPDLADVPLVGRIFHGVQKDFPDLPRNRVIHEAVRRMIGTMVRDVLTESEARLKQAAPQSADDVRGAGRALIGFSEKMAQENKELKKFLLERMYRHYKVNRMTSKGQRVIKDLFQLLVTEPVCLPEEWQKKIDQPDPVARVVADYVAGMTDRFAMQEHERLFDIYQVHV